ncbi:uncharacterized protein [Lepeophtheirus salmonis]|uniref:uncharacterized protein n=1 Tax=Lepeophtheirus salmonis TaxID=72036 RepID=UPI001AE96E89|nr:uncharacterized protein LOC121129602 [Lepeophtheirus salmonis]
MIKMCDALQINWKLPSSNSSSVLGPKKENKQVLRDYYHRSDSNNNNPLKRQHFSKKNDDSNGKYTLRACSIQKRIETESRKGQPRKRGPKPRPKPVPMSKYRRRTANQRERQRMGEINVAFEKLREKMPSPTSGKNRCEKMTKINILHVAINYIRALESILDTGDPGVQVYGTSIIRGPIKNDENTTAKSSDPSQLLLQTDSTPPSPVGEASEDSGIMEEEEDRYPDWTELTSTLDFPTFYNKIINKDISLTTQQLLSNSTRVLANKTTTLNLSEFLSSNSSQNNSNSSRPVSDKIPEEEPNLFNDLNSSFESISEGLVDFSHEDPFENLFF